MMLIVSRPRCAVQHDEDCAFQVAWEINPHMRIGAADCARAIEQHAQFVRSLRASGARVLQLPFMHGAFDSVFMKDSVVLREDRNGIRVLPATAKFSQRASEPGVRAQQLAHAGVAVEAALPVLLEGGDVVVGNGVAVMGYGVRTELAAAAHLERFLGCEVVPVRLRDPDLFHADVALTMLSSGAMVLCEEAFDRASLQALARIRSARTVAISKAEAMRFSLNIVEVGGTIVTGTPSAPMETVWRSLGYDVVVSPLDQFQLAGGSAACLVARVHEDVSSTAQSIAA